MWYSTSVITVDAQIVSNRNFSVWLMSWDISSWGFEYFFTLSIATKYSRLTLTYTFHKPVCKSAFSPGILPCPPFWWKALSKQNMTIGYVYCYQDIASSPFSDHSWQSHAFMLVFPCLKPFIGFFPSCILYSLIYLFSLTLRTLVLNNINTFIHLL